MTSIYDHPLLQNVRCGVSIPSGWVKIVTSLMAKLESFDGLVIHQVKSKWGGLRVYYSIVGNTDLIDKYIHDAEVEASHTCEKCGSDQAEYAYGITICDFCLRP